MLKKKYRKFLFLIIPLTIVGLGLVYPDNERHLKAGDRVSLLQTINIPDFHAHVILQKGKIVKQIDLQPYHHSCIVETRDLGPLKISPQVFTVHQVEYLEEMFSDYGAVERYYNEIDLTGSEIKIRLSCQIFDDTMQHHSFPISELKQITGSYFSFPD